MFLLTLLFCLFPALAAEPWHGYDLKSKPKVKVEKDRSAPGAEVLGDQSLDVPLPNNRALVGQRRRNLPHETPKLINWGGELSYGARTDLADQAKPRLYTHTLSLSYGFQHVPSTITLAGILGAAYDTTGGQEREVILDENDTELFVNNFTLAAQKGVKAAWDLDLEFSLANEFPTSPDARREGYQSVTWLSMSIRRPLLPKRLSVSADAEVYHLWNRYKYSPATGDINQTDGGRLTGGARLTIWRGLFVSGSLGAQISRYADGTSDRTYRNAATLGYAFPPVTVSLTTSNGTYLDREDATIWFVDDYRRTLSFAARLSF